MSVTAKPRRAASARVTKIRARWDDPAQPRATLIRTTPSGRTCARAVGPRTLLTLDEATAVLRRSREAVERSIRARFLRPILRNGRRYITMQACAAFRQEEERDLALARARTHEPTIPAAEVYRRAAL